MPRYADIDWTGLKSVTPEQFEELMRVSKYLWQIELDLHGELFQKLKVRLPRELTLHR